MQSNGKEVDFTCSSPLGWGEERCVSVRVRVATAAPMPASVARPTVPASPATDAQLTLEPVGLVTLWGMVLL